jgi:GNAT superfamily N-acetyltransferase
MAFTIQPFKPGQEADISAFIRNVYDEFVAPDYTEEGNAFFYDWITPENIADRQKTRVSLFVAVIDSTLAGMIEIRENNMISLLFVAKKYHRQGMAKSLVAAALNNSLANNENLDAFHVHASPFSIPVYRRLGFRESGVLQKENGIAYLPMIMKW